MAMDTVTGDWSGAVRVAGVGRSGGLSRRAASLHGVPDDVPAGGAPVTWSRRRPPGRPSGGGPAVCGGAHAPDLHGSRLTARGRVVVAMVWLVMAGIAALMLATVPGDGSPPPSVTTKVMVEPGETLWQLAADVGPVADRHETVATIMSLNDLESASHIRPGDILLVPAQP